MPNIDLTGVGAQFNGSAKTTSTKTQYAKKQPCAYHTALFADPNKHTKQDTAGSHGVNRFLREDAGQQSAVVVRGIDGKLSIHKPCECNKAKGAK